MKKIYLLLFFAANIIHSSGQSLNYAGGDLVISGAASTVRLESDLSVANTASVPLYTRCQPDNSQLLAGQATTFCWALCYDTTTVDFPDTLVLAARSTDSDHFHSYLYPNNIAGSSTLSYLIYDVNDPSDTLWLRVNFQTSAVGINEIASIGHVSSASPNPANNLTSITYSLASPSNAHLVISNMLGSVIKDIHLGNQTQSAVIVSTADLPSGVYMYSLISNNEPVSVKKLIVSHR